MVKVVGIKFKNAGKIYDFKNATFVLKEGDKVIVETEQGLGFGTVVVPPVEIEEQDRELKNIVRMAVKEDFNRIAEIRELENQASNFCCQCINELELLMNLFNVECTFDMNKLTFFYTADGRIDFRELIKLLVREFNIRIEMRQVGIRNLSKHCGGIGKCGREICCSLFLNNFSPVSIKMAKEQGLSLNPTKISGVCGRLMCCLTYENETYKDLKQNMPKTGKRVMLKEGQGKIIRQNPLKGTVTIKLADNNEVDVPVDKVAGDRR
jgi:cell fate regulator YaaT (PSP1 superfamily)